MGQIIRLTNNSFLREHPFGDPLAFPFTPEKFNAFIFKGDELLLWHKLSLPDDISAASISDIKFISAKVSLIAKKPQVFSEEFNSVFKSTRTFTLDSFVTSFNDSNLNVQPWGSDGYAPNIHLNQDRSWRLPPGDLRREIKFFTRHTSSTTVWDYYFYFPVIFRWEYWAGLIGVSDDFFDLNSPQDGKNQDWFHYFTSAWKIFSRLEINCLVNGEATIIRAELNLTPGRGDVNDYSSNSDYIDKQIQTSAIGGTLSNAPAFVYGNQDTLIVADLKKNSAWAFGERANISAVLWIEPFEGSGLTARTRGSSLYDITPESVFKGVGTAATDSSGIGVTDGASYVVLNNAGKGAVVLFNGGDPTMISIVGVIDYNKLLIAYPEAKKFTIYARLYNSTLETSGTYTGQTIKGEEIFQLGTLALPITSNSLCEQKQPDCPFTMDVFADLTDADDLKNDKSDFYAYGDATTASVQFVLGRQLNCTVPLPVTVFNGGDFNDDFNNDFSTGVPITNIPATFASFIRDLTGTLTLDKCVPGNITLLTDIHSNLLGKFFEYGKSNDFLGNDFEDDYGKKYTGLLLEWRKVLQQYGEGKYQIFIIRTDAFGNATVTCDSRIFCLKKYNCNFTNRTVRIEVINEGLRGSFFDEANPIDYMAGWYSQYRLKGVLKSKKSTYVNEYNQYGESKFNAYRPIINEQSPKFLLSIRPIPGWMDFILSTNVLQADEIRVTDYNTNNRLPLIRIPVMNDGEYEPRDNKLANPLSDVEISFAYGLNNLRKRNSQ